MSLFRDGSLGSALDSEFDGAMQMVNVMTLSQLRGPALAGALEGLWNQRRPNVPVLLPDQKSGTKREEERMVEDFGRMVPVRTTIVDVRIPFRGDASMFGLSPSTCAMISERFQVNYDNLVYTMPLDPTHEGRLNALIGQIESNLQTMRKEEEAFARTAIARLSKAAAARRTKLEADEKSGSGFSFKID